MRCAPYLIDATKTIALIAAVATVAAAQSANPEQLFNLAAKYDRDHEPQRSIAALNQLPADEQSRPGALVLRAADLLALHRDAEAQDAVTHAVASPEFIPSDAVWLLRRLDPEKDAALIVTLAPAATSIPDRRKLIQAYERRNQWQQARQALESVSAAEPNNPRHLLELARVSYKLNDFNGALAYLGHARDLDPQDAHTHNLIGWTLLQMNLPYEAQNSFEKAVSIDPANPDYNLALGMVLLNMRDPSRPIPYLQKYVTARPSDSKGHVALGRAYFNIEDYPHCREQMLQAPQDGIAAYFLGRVAQQGGATDEAAAYFERAMKLAPDFTRSYAELARIRTGQGRFQDAHAIINQALAAHPDSFQVHLALLALLQRTHDPHLDDEKNKVRELDNARAKQRDELERLMTRAVDIRPY